MKPSFGSVEYILEQLSVQPPPKDRGPSPSLPRGPALTGESNVVKRATNRSSLRKWCKKLYDAPEAALARFGTRVAERCDLFTTNQLARAFAASSGGDEPSQELEHELVRLGHDAVNGGRKIQTSVGAFRLFAVRDEPLWHEASQDLLIRHFEQFQRLIQGTPGVEVDHRADGNARPGAKSLTAIAKPAKSVSVEPKTARPPTPVSLRRYCEGLREEPERLLKPLGKLLAEKCDLFTADELLYAFDPGRKTRIGVDSVLAELKRCRYRPVNKGLPVRIDGEQVLLFPIRDESSWRGAHSGLCTSHFKRFGKRKLKRSRGASR